MKKILSTIVIVTFLICSSAAYAAPREQNSIPVSLYLELAAEDIQDIPGSTVARLRIAISSLSLCLSTQYLYYLLHLYNTSLIPGVHLAFALRYTDAPEAMASLEVYPDFGYLSLNMNHLGALWLVAGISLASFTILDESPDAAFNNIEALNITELGENLPAVTDFLNADWSSPYELFDMDEEDKKEITAEIEELLAQ
ncbi:MAG: hypothetical protein GY868_00135 [Deltaproteobacteria bacterium]|nr:hypothetical protein [Deltaproteobacteria bacterium]